MMTDPMTEIIRPGMSHEAEKAFAGSLTATMVSVYGDANFDRASVMIWVNVMKERCTVGEFVDALGAHMGNPTQGVYKPKPADIIRRVSNFGLAAEKAYKRLDYVVRHVGHTRSVEFQGDPAMHQAINMLGGWVNVCKSLMDPAEDAGESRMRFIKAYRECLESPFISADGFSEPLLGSMDGINGYKSRPFLIAAPTTKMLTTGQG